MGTPEIDILGHPLTRELKSGVTRWTKHKAQRAALDRQQSRPPKPVAKADTAPPPSVGTPPAPTPNSWNKRLVSSVPKPIRVPSNRRFITIPCRLTARGRRREKKGPPRPTSLSVEKYFETNGILLSARPWGLGPTWTLGPGSLGPGPTWA